MGRTTWALLAAAFALGAGTGLLAGAGLFQKAEDRLEPGQPAAERNAAAGLPSSTAGPGTPAAGTPGETPEPLREGESLLARAVAEIRVPDAPAGTGVFTGTVKTAEGKPLAGVLVRATRTRGNTAFKALPDSGAPPTERDLEAELREMAERSKAEKAGRREAVTGHDGSYAIQGLPDGRYSLSAFKEGWRIWPTAQQFPVKPGAEVDFLAQPLLEVPVDVLLPDGTRPARARISIRQGTARPARNLWKRGFDTADPRGMNWTPEKSLLWLQPGTYNLTAETGEEGEEAETKSALRELTVEEGTSVPAVILQLKESIGIKGKVVLPPGLEADTITVRLAPLAAGETPDPKKLLESRTVAQAGKGDSYSFSFRGLEPGTYLVGASYGWAKIQASTTVPVSDRMAIVELSLPPLDPRETVVVRGYGPGGELLLDIQVYAMGRLPGGGTSGWGQVIAQKDGAYKVFLQSRMEGDAEAGGARGERHFAVAESKKFGRREEEFVPGRDAEVAVRFQEPAKAEVTVAGYAGSGMEGKLSLSIEAAGPANREERNWGSHDEEGIRPNAAGVQTLGPVQPGPYEIALRYSGDAEDEWSSASVLRRIQATLRSGTTNLTVEIPALHGLTVWIEKGGEGDSVFLSGRDEDSEDGFHRRKSAGKDGRAAFDRLPAGEYVVQVESREGQMRVTVPGQAVVKFEPATVRAFLVTVTDPEGTVARAGFKSGDLIIGVEGVEFKNEKHMQAMVFGVMSKKDVKILVQREGQKVELTADMNQLLGGEADPGAEFEPTCR